MLNWALINLFQMLIGLSILGFIVIGIALLINVRDSFIAKRCLKAGIICVVSMYIFSILLEFSVEDAKKDSSIMVVSNITKIEEAYELDLLKQDGNFLFELKGKAIDTSKDKNVKIIYTDDEQNYVTKTYFRTKTFLPIEMTSTMLFVSNK